MTMTQWRLKRLKIRLSKFLKIPPKLFFARWGREDYRRIDNYKAPGLSGGISLRYEHLLCFFYLIFCFKICIKNYILYLKWPERESTRHIVEFCCFYVSNNNNNNKIIKREKKFNLKFIFETINKTNIENFVFFLYFIHFFVHHFEPFITRKRVQIRWWWFVSFCCKFFLWKFSDRAYYCIIRNLFVSLFFIFFG